MDSSNNVIGAYSEDQVERLTGISKSQLAYWDRTGFYTPGFAEKNRRIAYSRIYSFKDLVALRVLNILRNQYSVSLHHLRDVSERLGDMESDPDRWIKYDLYILNRKVVWHEPETDLPQVIASKQYIVPTMNLQSVVSDTKEAVLTFTNRRENSKIGQIERSRYINHNLPVIAGTRIPVNAIKRFSNAGYSVDQIILEYPDLTLQDIKSALEYGGSKSAA